MVYKHSTSSLMPDLLLPMLLFGSMGAITWAIRGTDGWGGVDGTIVPGMTWGLLWYGLSHWRGVDDRGMVLWLGLGIALGGELGYGQYVSWIQGKLHVNDSVVPIASAIGYVWLLICGIGWAAPGGVILGWALGGRTSTRHWLVRSLLLLILLVLLFVPPVIDWLGERFLQIDPTLLFPQADSGRYAGVRDHHLERTIYTNTQNFSVLVWWGLALLVGALQRDRKTLVTGLVLGLGFGLGFMQSAMWCLGYEVAPDYIDWWKMWELNAGFDLGVLYAILFYWHTRHREVSVLAIKSVAHAFPSERLETLALAFVGASLILLAGFEYFFWTGLFLSSFYLVAIGVAGSRMGRTPASDSVSDRRQTISFIYGVFLLLFILFHGGSSRAGVILGLYSADAVDQYAWPAARILLFVPVAVIVTAATVWYMIRVFRLKSYPEQTSRDPARWSIYMIDLMTAIGCVGALSIWPAKIGVLYAFFLFLALFAFNRMDKRRERALPS
jgi:hypothetical protein